MIFSTFSLVKRRPIWVHILTVLVVVVVPMLIASPVDAAVDAYVTRYLRVTEPVSLPIDSQGETRLFSPTDLSAGKQLFERNCLNCHVGGNTLPNPAVPLSLKALKGATPPRDTINALVDYIRQPMSYDGSEASLWCREVPETWLAQADVEKLASFILQASYTAPGWGTETFEQESIGQE